MSTSTKRIGKIVKFSRRPALKGWRTQYYFHYVAPNGEIVIPSEGYNNRSDRDRGVEIMIGLDPNTPVIDKDAK